MRTVGRKTFKEIKSFDFVAVYAEATYDSIHNVFESHIHDKCEIYINISGDVSFVVEGNIYPIKYGDIIITRPFEYHHCVYHSEKVHKHFCISFSPLGNEHLFDMFFKRNIGQENCLNLSPEDTEKLISVCHKLTDEDETPTKNYCNFFDLMNLLYDARAQGEREKHFDDVSLAIEYINAEFACPVRISDIAKKAGVSVNTLERHFQSALLVSPREYLKKKRLANATMLLSNGATVTEASEQSGFSDYSSFISLFKTTYGVTPLKYKKSIKK